ncbi:MAG: outer membrane lipoprotein carrier protein LolA [Desulfotignum sp.]|nr:outer membrane lipoprotein carrier protein LolA [Desulfotignum sp.]
MEKSSKRTGFRMILYTLTLFMVVCCNLFPGSGVCTEAQINSEEGHLISEDRLQIILSNVENNLGRINTLKTKLIQEKNIALFSEPVLSQGILLFKSPGNIRFEFFTPFQSVLLVDDHKVATFEMFNGRWKQIDSGSKKMMGIILDHIAAWVKGQFNRDNLYRISGRYRQNSKRGCTIILEPRAKEFKNFIQAFELGINSDMDRLDYIIIRESGNDYTKISFFDDRINIPLDDIYFAGDIKLLSPVPQW